MTTIIAVALHSSRTRGSEPLPAILIGGAQLPVPRERE